MIKEAERGFGKYILLGIILILVFISYKIVAPYIIILISAFVFAYLIRPVYRFLERYFSPSFSAAICIMIIFIIFIIPLTFIITNVAIQAYTSLNTEAFKEIVANSASNELFSKLNIDVSSLVSSAGDLLVSVLGSAARQLPSFLIGLVIFLFATFYLLTEWKAVIAGVARFIPLANKEKVLEEINYSTHGIIYGYFLIALIEFAVSALGFYLSGVQFFWLIAFLIAILVFIPGLGAIAIIIPMLIYYAVIGNWYTFIGVLITGSIVSFYLEFVLTAKVLGEKAKVHPMTMLLGIFGGTAVFGVFGFIIGPLVLVYTLKILQDLLRRV